MLSKSILGRVQNRVAWGACIRRARSRGKPVYFTVSAYRTWRGDLCYTDPVSGKPKATVLYRIRVYPKKGLALK